MGRVRKPDQKLQALAARIGVLETRLETRKAARVGREIFDGVYDGVIENFQSLDPTKAQSLSDLAVLLGTNRTRLWRLVATHIVYRDLPSDLRDRLKTGHLVLLYGEPDIERERWAREVVAVALTVDELEAHITGVDMPDPEPIDRSPIGRVERSAKQLEREAATATPEERPGLAARVAAVIAHLTGVHGVLVGATTG
jgi:hypothetical protein